MSNNRINVIKDFSKYFSKISKRRKPNLIRHLTSEYAKNPKAIFLAGGLPNAEMFPFKEISVTYKDDTCRKFAGDDLFSALQYGPSSGYPPLINKWHELQEKWHSPKYDDWDIQITAGSCEGFSKVFDLFIEENDSIMIQIPAYTGIITAIAPMRPELISIETDEDGILPNKIIAVCEEKLKLGKPLPKLLYVNPTGSNPSGIVFSEVRKNEIYKLAQKYDFFILEDDAYYFLHFLDNQPKSFLSWDTDGRVIRLDSFSKTMSAGLRLGTVTAHKEITSKLNLHVAVSTLHASSISQVLVYELLRTWSYEKLMEHLSSVRMFYQNKRDMMLKIVEKHFTGIAEWNVPKGGMFIWLKLNIVDDVYDLVMNKCVPKGLFILPGHAFQLNDKIPCQYVRLCFSKALPEEVEKGLSEVARIAKEYARK